MEFQIVLTAFLVVFGLIFFAVGRMLWLYEPPKYPEKGRIRPDKKKSLKTENKE